MSAASALEWYMLDLINQERTSRGLSELQMELNLNESAEIHTDWMIANDRFSHTGSGGSSATQRMDSAGFDFVPSWGSGENIAYQSLRGEAGVYDDVEDLHQNLMNSSGHRANILNPNFEAIGIGIEVGEYNGFTIAMVTQNFAYTAGSLDIDTSGGGGDPGVVVPDPTTGTGGDDVLSLSSPGRLEGFAGDDDMTGSSGDDTLLGGWGEDTIEGGSGSDEINGGAHNDLLIGDGGDDFIFAKSHDDTVYGGSGDDEIKLGWGADVAYGGADDDLIRGSGGSDIINGDSGNDMLYGDAGFDTLNGGSGNDVMRGGNGNDRFNGGSGNDSMYGGAGADVFVFSSGDDKIFGFEENLAAEKIDLSPSSRITSYNDLMQNHIRDIGSAVEIYDGLGNTLLVNGVNISDLDSTDFLF